MEDVDKFDNNAVAKKVLYRPEDTYNELLDKLLELQAKNKKLEKNMKIAMVALEWYERNNAYHAIKALTAIRKRGF